MSTETTAWEDSDAGTLSGTGTAAMSALSRGDGMTALLYCHDCGDYCRATEDDGAWHCDECGSFILCDLCGQTWTDAHNCEETAPDAAEARP